MMVNHVLWGSQDFAGRSESRSNKTAPALSAGAVDGRDHRSREVEAEIGHDAWDVTELGLGPGFQCGHGLSFQKTQDCVSSGAEKDLNNEGQDEGRQVGDRPSGEEWMPDVPGLILEIGRTRSRASPDAIRRPEGTLFAPIVSDQRFMLDAVRLHVTIQDIQGLRRVRREKFLINQDHLR